MKIVYLLPVVSQARYHKRVQEMTRFGVQSEILAFERTYYQGKPWPDGYHSMGHLKHGHYFKRLPILFKAVSIVCDAANKSKVIYAFSLDTLLIAWLATRQTKEKVKLVYEVGDIRQILLGNGVINLLLRWIERYLLHKVGIVVVTSEAYVSGYFRGIQQLTNVRYQVIENKLDPLETSLFPRPVMRKKTDDILRIGYFGLIRCRHTLKVMQELARQGSGRIQVYIRGIFMSLKDQETAMQSAAFIEYGGPYISPDDLPNLYNNVDMVWACYPYNSADPGNWRWARTNRFYEACFFRRPMFVQLHTEDSRAVETFDIGVSLDLKDIEMTINRIMQIKTTDIEKWQMNMNDLPREVYMLSNEHEQLMEALK